MTGRVVSVVLVIGVIALALWGMRRGWVGRQQRQADIPAPPATAVGVVEWLADEPGGYVGCSRAGDWLDRIAVHDLGVPSKATCHVGPAGVWLERQGARSAFIPAGDIEMVRVDRGIAASIRERDSVVIVRWRLGQAVVEAGFHPATAAGQRTLLEAMAASGLAVQMETTA